MIVITTPTGHVGGRLLDLLVGAGEQLRAIARTPDKLDDRYRSGVEVIEGSHDDPDVVDRALEGADALFWLVPPNPRAADQVAYYREFTAPACTAIERHGVPRVVAVSSLGRDYPAQAGLLTAAFDMEALLEQTAAELRILRMPYYMENLLSQADALRNGALALPNDPDRPLATCATRDIAAIAADLLRDRAWTGRQGVCVVGPDDLTPRGIADVLSDTLEWPVGLTHVPLEEFAHTLTGYGFSDSSAQAYTEMVRAQDDGIYDAEVASAERTPTSLRDWTETVLRPALR